MIDMAFKNLLARKARSVLCILAVMVSVYLNGSTMTMVDWMYATMTGELAKYMGQIYVQQSGSSYPPFDSSLSEEIAQEVMQHSDINLEESTPLIFVRTERGMMPFMPAEAMVIGIPPGKEGALLGNLEAASGVNSFGEEEEVAILGEGAATYYDATVGQEITINERSLRVIGVLKKSSMASVNLSAILPLVTAQNVFGKEGTVSAVLLTPRDVTKVEEIASALEEDYPILEIVTQEDMVKEAEKVLEQPIMYMSAMSLTAFIVAVAVIMSTMVMAVMERTREIGTLRAMGAKKRTILATIFGEILILSLVGGVPGVLLTIPMARLMEAEVPTPGQLLQVLLWAVIAGSLAGLYPAWRAARVDPLEALRYE
jgi:putative ABC transport system permease protein